jgi:hypothetical protein
MKVGFAGWSVGPLWWYREERPEVIEERSAKRRWPRSRVGGVGDGVADPGESGESLLDVGQWLGRADGGAGFFENFEEMVLVALDG